MGHGEIVSTSSPERPVPVATDGIRVLLPPPRKEDKGASGAGGNDAESPPAVVSSRSPRATLVGLPPAAMIPRPMTPPPSPARSSIRCWAWGSTDEAANISTGRRRFREGREDRDDLQPVITCGMAVPVSLTSVPLSHNHGVCRCIVAAAVAGDSQLKEGGGDLRRRMDTTQQSALLGEASLCTTDQRRPLMKGRCWSLSARHGHGGLRGSSWSGISRTGGERNVGVFLRVYNVST